MLFNEFDKVAVQLLIYKVRDLGAFVIFDLVC